jgi:ankyrin repeat protein
MQNGMTALMHASVRDRSIDTVDTVTLLLERGANMHIKATVRLYFVIPGV